MPRRILSHPRSRTGLDDGINVVSDVALADAISLDESMDNLVFAICILNFECRTLAIGSDIDNVGADALHNLHSHSGLIALHQSAGSREEIAGVNIRAVVLLGYFALVISIPHIDDDIHISWSECYRADGIVSVVINSVLESPTEIGIQASGSGSRIFASAHDANCPSKYVLASETLKAMPSCVLSAP